MLFAFSAKHSLAFHSFVKAHEGGEDSTKNKSSEVDLLILQDSLEALDKKIQVSFKIKKSEQSPDSVYFNVFTVTNTTSKSVVGDLKVRVPEGWKLIADPSMDNISLAAGESITLPLRISIPVNAVGGVAYVVDVSFTNNEGVFSGATYIKIPMKSKWDAEVFEKEVYFNELFDQVPFKLKLINKGNSKELLKLKLKVGKMFNLVGVDKEEMYIELDPYQDTVLSYTVENNLTLTPEEKAAYAIIWDESAIKITVTGSGGKTFRDAVYFNNLENDLINARQERNTPLNIDVGIFNMLSPNPVFVNTTVFGQILFNGNHDLSYFLNLRNIYRNGQLFGPLFFSNPNNYRFRLAYEWNDKVFAEAGLITNYTMNTGRGWGAKARYKFTDKNEARVSFVRNQFLPIDIYSGEYIHGFGAITANVGLSYERNDFVKYNAYSLQLGASVPIVRGHFVSGQVLLTNAIFDASQFGLSQDSSLIGVSYNFKYNGIVSDKLRMSFSTRNDLYNYIRMRPMNVMSGNLRYVINAKSTINGLANYTTVQPSRYSLSPFYAGMYTRTQVYRLTYQRRVKPNISVEAGPLVKILNRSTYETLNGKLTDYDNYFIGGYANTRIRVDDFTFVTPNVTIGRTSFRNRVTDSTLLAPILTSSFGLSVTSRNYNVNASYIHGPLFFVNDDYVLIDDISMETVTIRGQAEKLVRNNTIKLTGYATYYLRLPSNRQNFILSGRSDFFFPKGWRAYLTASFYTNSAVNPNVQDISTQRFFSLNAGVIKSFGLNQPRIKYYDIEVICFNDFNGDGERQENEPLLPNIKVKVSIDPNYDDPRGIKWVERELITSVEGKCRIFNMPNASYLFNFDPMVNLGSLYNVNGDNQVIDISDDRVIMVPYAESYRVYGKVVLNRDEHSSKGLINVGGVRITATNMKGNVFSVLTDNEGNYMLNVPQAGSYVIKVNNVFGDEFYIDKESFVIQFDGFKTYQLDFAFYENKRGVNFGNGSGYDFKSLNRTDEDQGDQGNGTGGSEENESGSLRIEDPNFMQDADKLRAEIDKISKENEKVITTPVNPDGVRYMVEIGIFNDDVDTDAANVILNLGFSPTVIKVEGVTVYATPVKKTHAEISEVLTAVKEAGLSEALIVGVYEGKVITEQKAREYRNE